MGKKKLIVVHRTYLRQIQGKSIIRTLDDEDQIVPLLVREPSARKYRNLDREVVHVLLVGLNLIEHAIGSEVDLE